MERTLAAPARVERFGPCAQLPGRKPAFFDAQRIEDAQGRLLDVLYLSFRFNDKFASIFHTLLPHAQPPSDAAA